MLASPTAPARSPASRGKKEDILEAALALFVDRGFHGTAVPALAQRARVGAGTIYRYFENKEALVNELYRHWKAAISEHITTSINPTAEPREIFANFWTKTIEFARENPAAFAFLELHHHASYLDQESVAAEERAVATARRLIVSLQERGGLKAMPAGLLMSMIHGALTGFVQGAWEGRYPLDEAHSSQAEECAWAAIRR